MFFCLFVKIQEQKSYLYESFLCQIENLLLNEHVKIVKNCRFFSLSCQIQSF